MRRGRQQGATLIEILMVLAIAGSLLLASVKMYQSFQATYNIQQLEYNVTQLLEASANYYYANCSGSGALAPSYSTGTSGPINYSTLSNTGYVAVHTSALTTGGYLSNWYPANPLVDASGGDSGYIVQFNPVILTTLIPIAAIACVVTNPGTACTPFIPSGAHATTIPTTQATVVNWNVQVAVKLTTSAVKGYGSSLGADCYSNTASSTTVTPCASSAGGNYVVWQRSPAVVMAKASSLIETIMPIYKQFNLQYTHDQNYEYNLGYTATTTPAIPIYYVCGG